MRSQPPPVMLSTLEAIGNTPLVELRRVVSPESATVLVKLEYYNPRGSYKDRMALSMVEEAEKRGDLRPGMTVVEYTGGSTGSSLALVCAIKGYAFKAVSSDAFARDKLATMRAFGADLHLEPSVGGMITPDLVPRMMELAGKIATEEGTYFTNQFHNADMLIGYEQIGEEMVQQMGGAPDVFCGGVGSGGMLMGVARALRLAGETRIVALEPGGSPLLSTGRAGVHHVEGIGTGMIPPLLDKEFYNEARAIDEQEARIMARRLAREEGIFAGTSTGLNVVAAIGLAQELGPGHTVATIAVDTGLKYLAGDLFALD